MKYAFILIAVVAFFAFACTNNTELESLQTQVDDLDATVVQQQESITTLEATIVERDATVADLQERFANIPEEVTLLQECPEEWIENTMPADPGADGPAKNYFNVGGERRELTEYDLPWVFENCNIEKMEVS